MFKYSLSTFVTSVVLYSLTRATPISHTTLGRTKHVYVDIRSEFIHWALWRTLMRTEYFLFVHHTTSILAKVSTWCFEHSGEISFSLLVNPSHTDESWEGRVCGYLLIIIYFPILIKFILVSDTLSEALVLWNYGDNCRVFSSVDIP